MQSRQERHSLKQQPVVRKHHTGAKFLGVVLLVVCLMSTVLGQTVLNEKFVAHQVTESQVGDEIVSDVNQSAAQYGLTDKIMTKKIADELLTDAVGDVFADRTVNIDFTPVYNRVDQLVSDKLAGVGYSSSGLSTTLKTQLRAGMTSIINRQLDTSELATISSDLASAKMVVHVIQVISLVGLILLLLVALLRRYALSWLGVVLLIGGILSYLAMTGLSWLLGQVLDSQTTLASFNPQLPNAISSAGMLYFVVAIVAGVVCLFIHRLLK